MSYSQGKLGRVWGVIQVLLKSSRYLTIMQNLIILRFPSKKFWTWEVYGLGASTKNLLGLPPRTILTLGSDHGINLTTVADEMEQSLGGSSYITWSSWRADLIFEDLRKVIVVQHPWVAFRKQHKIEPRAERVGTLAFSPHTVPGMRSEKFDYTEYIIKLSNLPPQFQPVTLCLHVHDAKLQRLMEVSRLGVRIVTVGHSLNYRYTERFYELVGGFRYCTSPKIGSQLFYAEEFGIDYFLFNPTQFRGDLPEYSGPPLDSDLVEEIESAFSLDNLLITREERKSIIRRAMGLDFARIDSQEIRRLLIGLDGASKKH